MNNLDVKKGRHGYILEITVRSKGVLFDLTGYAVVMKVAEPGATSAKWTLTGTLGATTGLVNFTVSVSDFNVEGAYLAELEWTKTGILDGSETFQITVLSRIT